MAKSIALAADASRLASLLLSYIQAVCAFVAPCQPGASTAIIDRLSHSRALTDDPAAPEVVEALGAGADVLLAPADDEQLSSALGKASSMLTRLGEAGPRRDESLMGSSG